ncbi:hypothetical protein [Arcanobacterium hippocoleae]|uniref:hypothetical protein n=1 Tax=Arcanobacterium hippocoleae TaxID=149017 RepID=UPI003341E1A5
MTIEIAASRKALTESGPLDYDDPSQLPDFYTTATLGFDLSGLGARPTEIPGEYGPEMAVSALNFPLLVASVNAAFQGGIDYIQLNHNFQMYGGEAAAAFHQSALLDGVKTAEKIAEMVPAGGLNIEVPLDLELGLPAIKGFLADFSGKKSISVGIREPADIELLARFSQAAKENNLKIVAICADLQFLTDHAAKIAGLVDSVQLRDGTIAQAREMRFCFHELGKTAGRKIKLVVELGIVISATVQSATERAALISELSHSPLFDGIANSVGTVYDVADQIEKWVGSGAADGILFVPASLPTDLASVLKG